MDINVNKKVSFFNECNIYILLWVTYYLLSAFNLTGNIISQGILIIAVLFSVINAVRVNLQGGLSKYFKTLNILLFMFTIYGVFLILGSRKIVMRHGSVPNWIYLFLIYQSLLPIYSFYLYSRKGLLDEDKIRSWIIAFFVISILTYFAELYKSLYTSLDDEVTNNSGYDILSLMPLIILWKRKPLFQYLLLGISMGLILISMKRGAILIAGLCLIWFLHQSFKNTERINKKTVLVLTIITIAVGIFAISFMLENDAFFAYRFEQTKEGDVSGRDILAEALWNNFKDKTTTFQFFLGQGASATVGIAGNYAHNDWLEILINNGLMGLIIYFIYWVSFYEEWKSSKYDSCLYMALGLSFLINFMVTLFSMSYGNMSLYATCALGYSLGRKSVI